MEQKTLEESILYSSILGTCCFDTCSWNNMTAYSGSYTLWLKSNTKYSIAQVNNLSVIPACLGFAYVIFVPLVPIYLDVSGYSWFLLL